MGTKDHLRAALQLLSGDVPRRTVYRHLDWRNLGGAWSYRLAFAREAGAIDEAEQADLWRRGWAALNEAAAAQATHLADAEPAGLFLRLLSAAVAGGYAHLADGHGEAPEPQRCGWRPEGSPPGGGTESRQRPQGVRVGWLVEGEVYLEPDAAFAAVQRFARDQSEGFAITPATLRRRLKERRLLASTDSARGKLTVRKTLQGARREVLHVSWPGAAYDLIPYSLWPRRRPGLATRAPAGRLREQMIRWPNPSRSRRSATTPRTAGAAAPTRRAPSSASRSRKYFGLVPQPDGRRKPVPLCNGLAGFFTQPGPAASRTGPWKGVVHGPEGRRPAGDQAGLGAHRRPPSSTRGHRPGQDPSLPPWHRGSLAGPAAWGASVETSNQYLSHLKSFCRWLVRDQRTGANPLLQLEAGNAQVDRRHDRRELEAEELRQVLAVTRSRERSYRGLTGADRYAFCATACGTGFRASALASLTPEGIDLDGEVATVTLATRRNKSRVLKVQPIPPDLAQLLRDYLQGKPAGQAVWGGTWARDRKGAEMLRLDLEAAGIPYAIDGPDGPLYADFHALQHTYLTLGSRAGIDLRTLQELAGHSSPVLTARNAHRRLHDLAGAVEKLPNFLPGRPEKIPAAGQVPATGTDGIPFGCSLVAQSPIVPGHRQASSGTERGEGPSGIETTKPQVSPGFSHLLASSDIANLQGG
jgi:integrase